MLKEIKKTFLLLLVAIVLIFFLNIVLNNSIAEMKDYALNKISPQQANYTSNTPEITMKHHAISNKDKRCNDLIAKSWTDKSAETKKAKAEACAHNKNN